MPRGKGRVGMLTTKTDPFYSRLRKEKVDPSATLHIYVRVST